MDSLKAFQQQIQQRLGVVLIINNLVLVGLFWLSLQVSGLNHTLAIAGLAVIGFFSALGIAVTCSTMFTAPVRALWQAIIHLNPAEQNMEAPQLDQLKTGRELVAKLVSQLYELQNIADTSAAKEHLGVADLYQNFIATKLPLPLLMLDNTETILFANQTAADYIGLPIAELTGKNVYMVLDMMFPNEDTFDTWLKNAKQNSASASGSWERVHLNVRDNHPARHFDLAAYYNRDNPDRLETMLVLFDHTKQYSQDDQAISFIALSVHELRTPLTLLRGYIEVFEEELEGKIDPELHDFMLKMQACSQQLTAFVNNILNVTRIDNDQLQLQLQEEDWTEVLKGAIENLSLMARVRGITLQCKLATNMPKVGVDRLSIYEVVNNLVDNAIKYSGTSKTIVIDTHLNADGLIETTVQDFGVGISSAIMPNLFTKFYRDHRNRAQIGGTGLGLYLSKAIVNAHGGTLWVQSTEGQGSTFGFTLVPYAQLDENLKHPGTTNAAITRGAHGWIKNHSLYRQ